MWEVLCCVFVIILQTCYKKIVSYQSRASHTEIAQFLLATLIVCPMCLACLTTNIRQLHVPLILLSKCLKWRLVPKRGRVAVELADVCPKRRFWNDEQKVGRVFQPSETHPYFGQTCLFTNFPNISTTVRGSKFQGFREKAAFWSKIGVNFRRLVSLRGTFKWLVAKLRGLS